MNRSLGSIGVTLAIGLSLALLLGSCGGAKAPPGGFCDQDSDCQEGLVCRQNICTEPTTDCNPPCGNGETCVDGTCVPINPDADKDGDGFVVPEDCDDLDPFTHPADPVNEIEGGFEFCDGRDNDCDGETDEGCPACEEGVTQPCGSDIGQCTSGTQACTVGVWGTCTGQGPVAEQANDLDDDCDGVTDEGMPCESGQRPCGLEDGECTTGQQNCEEGRWSDCQEGAMATAERCNGLDDDCDGMLDEGFMIDQRCDGAGECGSGLFECASETTVRCSTESGGSASETQPESCNGLDDDCDGLTDEDFQIGQACLGTGMCGNGTYECLDGSTAICSTNPGGSQDQSRQEICDNLDNNCNGQTDEGFGTGVTCDGAGECGAGVVECATTTTTHCSTEPGGSQDQSSAELCDGLDNDCDGAPDDGFQVGDACDGVGACGAGQIECAGPSNTRCSTDPGGSQDQSSAESCDGLDNDCNGSTDDGNDQTLCQPLTAHVSVATCDRVLGACKVANSASDCASNFWDFDGLWSNGCELVLDGGTERPDTCASAYTLSAVSDAAPGSEVIVNGNLVPDGDEDWYVITALDDATNDENIDRCDNFHFRVVFTARPQGVVFDVKRAACTDTTCTGDSTFEHNLHFNSGSGTSTRGECSCSRVGLDADSGTQNRCAKADQTFYIRVYRLPNYAVTNQTYTLRITNGIE